MRLRKQLVFLSLITLALPWVGCQYIKEVDSALRQGQVNALEATARAVSARITSDPMLASPLQNIASKRAPLYVHPLEGSLYLDGYPDDWTAMGLTLQPMPRIEKPLNAQFALAEEDDKLFFYARVEKASIQYFTPTQPGLSNIDHLVITTEKGRFRIFARTPGAVMVARDTDDLRFNDKTREHRVKGFWREWDSGYQIEASLPRDWINDAMSFAVYDGSRAFPESEETDPLIFYSSTLAEHLTNFVTEGVKLQILSPQGHQLAAAGKLMFTPEEEKQHGLLFWLYRLALGKQYEEEDPRLSSAALTNEALAQTLKGETSARWFNIDENTVARVSRSAVSEKSPIAVVVAEQSARTLTSATSNAFSKLLAYSFIVSSLAALALIGYATWLSWRIRRLSEAAANAVSESGNISNDFPVLKGSDEISELSQNYAQLLARLREYTHYLRTLSSKLSHELRTPLAIVRSSLDNLEHEKIGEQARVYGDRAREGTQRLSRILDAMSAASRVEQAIGAADRETILCDQLLTNLKQAYEDAFPHVRFQLDIRPHTQGLEIEGAVELLVQAFDKLVDNAADFSPENGLITLGLSRHQNTIIFTFQNAGPPLPGHMQGQLFDSMVSLREPQSASESQHLGLGLYIVRLITDFHQGTVRGRNTADESGVIFEVKLPAKR